MKCFFLSREAVLKERKRRIKQTESLTPKLDFGVGGGVSKQLFLTDAVGDKSDEILPMWQLLRRVTKGATRLSKSYRYGIFKDGCAATSLA